MFTKQLARDIARMQEASAVLNWSRESMHMHSYNYKSNDLVEVLSLNAQ